MFKQTFNTMENLKLLKYSFVGMALYFVVQSNCIVFAQSQKTAQSTLYLELLGNGAIYSLNYDHLFSNNVGARFGGMVAWANEEDSDDNVNIATFNVMANYLIGSGKHKLEFGIGTLFAKTWGGFFDGIDDFDASGIFGTATVGYRLQPVHGGFVFRIGFTPIFTADGYVPWGGISFGSSF